MSTMAQTDRKPERHLTNNQIEKRVALIIGNGKYIKTKPLLNPVNDAEDMSAALKNLGFEVLSGVNLNKQQMEKLIRQFGLKLAGGGVGLFYYAGYSIQVTGENYLIPVDVDIPEEDEVSYIAVPVNLVLTKMTTAKNDLNIVILDASRSNPFARNWRTFIEGKSNDGLAKISTPRGTLVLYAAEPSKVATEAAIESRNSLFTEALLKQINKPNLEYNQMVKLLSAEVWERTNKQQLPWKEDNSPLDFYFAGNANSEITVKSSSLETKLANDEQTFWEEAERKNTAEMYESYITKYPKGDYVALARVKINELKSAVETVASAKERAEALMNQAGKETNLDLKIELFTKAIELVPKHPVPYAARALAYSDKQDYDRAIIDYSKAIEISPEYFDAFALRGLAYSNKKDYDRAIVDFSKAIDLNPKDALLYQERGQAFYYKNDFDRAIADYIKAIELNPKEPSVYHDRGIAYGSKRDFDRAITDLTKALEIDPKRIWTYYQRGLAYHEKKDDDRAIADFSKAIELNPKFPSSYNNRGRIYSDKKEYDKAIADFTKAIELDPKFQWSYLNRGDAFTEKKDYDRAIIDYSKAMEIDSRFIWAYFNRGNLYTDKKDYEKAIADYSKVIEIDPKFSFAYERRGKAYDKMGLKDLANADRKKYKELQDNK